MLIHLPFPHSVIISVLHLLKRGMERRGKKLHGLRVVVAISDVERGLSAATALLEISNAWPSDGDGAGVRGERGAGISVRGKREGKSYYGSKDKMKNKWALQ